MSPAVTRNRGDCVPITYRFKRIMVRIVREVETLDLKMRILVIWP